MKKRTICFITVLTTIVTLLGSWCIYWFLKEKAFEKELKQEEDLYDDFSDVRINENHIYNEMDYDLEEDINEELVDL